MKIKYKGEGRGDTDLFWSAPLIRQCKTLKKILPEVISTYTYSIVPEIHSYENSNLVKFKMRLLRLRQVGSD